MLSLSDYVYPVTTDKDDYICMFVTTYGPHIREIAEEYQNKGEFLISHISKYLTLKPGTIISTGTPAGTGMEQKPQKFLQVGDELHLKVDHLGEQSYKIIGDQ